MKNTLVGIESKIFIIRGLKVMLDFDLAELYQVPTLRLNQQVRRNGFRFPSDFMFPLTNQELINLKSQIVISSSKWGGRRTPPLALTEQGIAMLSSVLKSRTAVEVNIAIMRAFVQMRQILISNKDLEFQLREIESKIEQHDEELQAVFNALKKLMAIRAVPHKKIAGLGPK